MNKIATMTIGVLLLTVSGCSKLEFTKKQSGSFKANGTAYTTPEENVTAGYVSGNANLLQVDLFTGSSQSNTPTITVDLTRINEDVAVAGPTEDFGYTTTTGAYYGAAYAHYKITSHKEGDPSSRHTEGTFDITLYDTVNADTIRVTEGKFYVNNY